jgi:hypothetical protein
MISSVASIVLSGSPMLPMAYVPFKTPINALQDWWYLLLIPLSFGIALIYKALRVHDLSAIWRQTLLMTVQIILAIIGLAVALAVFILMVIPRLPV